MSVVAPTKPKAKKTDEYWEIINEFSPPKDYMEKVFHCKRNDRDIPIATCINAKKMSIELSKTESKDEGQWQLFKNCIDCKQGEKIDQCDRWCLYGHPTDKIYGKGLCHSHHAIEAKRIKKEERISMTKEVFTGKQTEKNNEQKQAEVLKIESKNDIEVIQRELLPLQSYEQAISKTKIELDFRDHISLLEDIMDLAKKEFRSPSGQIMAIVRDHLERMKSMIGVGK